MKQIYAVAYYCQRFEMGQVIVGYSVGAVRARSEAEAVGMGVELAKERNPHSAGWEAHQATVLAIPQNWIDEAVGL